jgi:hypothetical protein
MRLLKEPVVPRRVWYQKFDQNRTSVSDPSPKEGWVNWRRSRHESLLLRIYYHYIVNGPNLSQQYFDEDFSRILRYLSSFTALCCGEWQSLPQPLQWGPKPDSEFATTTHLFFFSLFQNSPSIELMQLPKLFITFAIVGFFLKRFCDSGLGHQVQNDWRISRDNCRKMGEGLYGIEDIVINKEKGIAYLSVLNRRLWIAKKEDKSEIEIKSDYLFL